MNRDAFITALAELLAGPPAIDASVRHEAATRAGAQPGLLVEAWFKLRGESGLFGYPTVEEARAELEKYFKK
jgi:hypothetical protein